MAKKPITRLKLPKRPVGSPPTFADLFASEQLQFQVDLQALALALSEEAFAELLELEEELWTELLSANLPAYPTGSVRQQNKQERLIEQTQKTIDSYYEKTSEGTLVGLRELAPTVGKHAENVLQTPFQGALDTTTLTPNDLKRLASDTMLRGAPQADWWDKQSRDLQMRFATQLRLGVAQGETNDQLVKRIIGGRTGKEVVVKNPDTGEPKLIPEYSGGIMDVSKREAAALVRTGVQTVSNRVLMDTYSANSDVLKGVQWLSTLDNRTTEFCMGMDGAAWDFDGNPLPDSPVQVPFPGPPPAHFNCRSVLIPLTKSWDDLSSDASPDLQQALDEVPDEQRSSVDGYVSGDLTYEDWLKGKSEDYQREVLGPGRYNLWTQGKLSFSDMVGPGGRSLTLEELKAKVGAE